MNFSAVVLAGGLSSRMGRDKAFVEIDGQTMLARQLEMLRMIGARETFISGRAGRNYSAFGARVVHDQFAEAGPLAGIHAALGIIQTNLLVVLAVDLTEMDAVWLAEQARRGIGVVPRVAGAVEPLAAVYPRNGFAIADLMLREGRFAVRDFAAACVEAGLAKFVDVPADHITWFKNVNSPADLKCPV